jgi:hypothetical protein
MTKNAKLQWAAGVLLAGGLLGQANAATVTKYFGDDYHTSTTTDHPGIQYSCPWIDTGTAAFKAANAGWDFKYAGAEAAAFLLNDLKVVSNFPWVVNEPKFTHGGQSWGGDGPEERGGAYIEISYTPHGTDPVNIRWIQAISASYYGGANDVHLDNPDDRSKPFYDVGPNDIAGTTWFADIPSAPENEYEHNPVAAVDFQVFLTEDKGAGNGFDHNVVVYGGVWWDYTYSAVDAPAPEPGSWLLFGGGGLLIGVGRLRRKRD